MIKQHHAVIGLLWIIVVASTAHFLYSSLGFNPTDDGFTLAYARRILDGQIPHRDFVIIRPALSPVLHLPELLVGGQFTFWISRFIFFFQCACIAWLGTSLICRKLGLSMGIFERCVFAVVAFAFGCHTFPAMAWHTIDGMLLCVLAIYIRSFSSGHLAPIIAYLLLGLACLCKQSFVFVAPVSLLLFADWKSKKNLLAAALPGILYLLMLAIWGGLKDGAHQLLSQTGLAIVGVYAYLNPQVLSGVFLGFIALGLFHVKNNAPLPAKASGRQFAGYALMAMILFFATKSLYNKSLTLFSFTLFGVVCGAVMLLVVKDRNAERGAIQAGIVVATLAWCDSLSLGYNTPALGSGLLIIYLVGIAYQQFPLIRQPGRTLVLLLGMLLMAYVFHHARTTYIYLDRPASKLTCHLDDLLPGGRRIRTNPNTYEFMADLNLAIGKVVSKGDQYAIIPDIAGYWAKSRQANPLPIDWPQDIELNTEKLRQRVIQSIENRRNKQSVIVQKVRASKLSTGFEPLDFNVPIVSYVRSRLQKIDETVYFDIYK